MSVEFIDTNVLVYAFDKTVADKHVKAISLFKELAASRRGALSTQVLQEFYVTVTIKVRPPMQAALARDIVRDLTRWRVVSVQVDSILKAIDTSLRHRISFWDGLIIASATLAGASIVWSEDLNDGQRYDTVEVRNPFK